MKRSLPIVQPDAVYASNAAVRQAMVDETRAKLAAAIAACGEGADEYGEHSIHDKLGMEPERVIFCCKRDGGDWDPPMPDVVEVRVLRQHAEFITRGGVRYRSEAITIEHPSWAPDPVTRFHRRYEATTFAIRDDYRPRSAEQLKAAAEARRAKAAAEQEAELEKERQRIANDPQLGLALGCGEP